jgi:hypothetical protein
MKKQLQALSLILFVLMNTNIYSQYWEAATPFSGVTGGKSVVSCMEIYNNELIVGGDYNTIGGIVANGIAKWNGVNWSNLGQLNLVNSIVSDLITYNNKLYFMSDKLYVWDGNTVNAVTYNSSGQTLNINGNGDLHVFNGQLYIVASSKIVKYNGVSVTEIPLTTIVKGSPRCLDNLNNILYLGTDQGLFKYQNNIWVDVTGICTMPPVIIDIEPYNNELYVLGYFPSIGGLSINNFAKFNGNSWSLTSFPDNSSYNMNTNPYGALQYNCGTNHLNVMNNELYLAQIFTGSQLQLQKYTPLIKFNGTNWLQLSLNSSVGSGGCSIFYNNTLFCGGQFSWLSDSQTVDVYNHKIAGIAKLNTSLTAVNEISSKYQNIYPNPTSSEVKITINPNQLGKSFTLFDNIGREKMRGVFNSTEYILNLESFEPGIYLLKTTEEETQFKIVKN